MANQTKQNETKEPILTVTLPASITVELPKEAGSFDLNIAKLDRDTIVSLLRFGLKEKANNAAAGKQGAEAKGAILTTLDNIQANVMRGGGGGRTTDPAVRMAKQEAVEIVKGAYIAKGHKMADVDKASFRKNVAKYFDANREALVAAARKRLDAATVGEVELTLD